MNYKNTEHTLTKLVTLTRTARTLLYDVREDIVNGTLEVATGNDSRKEYIYIQGALVELSKLINHLTTIPEEK